MAGHAQLQFVMTECLKTQIRLTGAQILQLVFRWLILFYFYGMMEMSVNVTGEEKHMARSGLEPRTSRIPCEHSDHRASEPHGRPVTISLCLTRFVPESARDHAGTDPHWRTNVTGEKNAHGPTGTRKQDLSHAVRAL